MSKLAAQSSELETLQQAHKEMHSKQAMQELLLQQVGELWGGAAPLSNTNSSLLFPQLQSSPPHTPTALQSQPQLLQEQLKMAEEEVKTMSIAMQAVSRERDQALSDVAALREAIMNNKQDEARKVSDWWRYWGPSC